MKTHAALPSNRQFGLVFGSLLPAIYFLFAGTVNVPFFAVCGLIIVLGLFNSKLLTPFNAVWMQFGLLLGRITSPIALGFLYFLILTPVAITFRLIKRDELSLRPSKAKEQSFFVATQDNGKFDFDEQF